MIEDPILIHSQLVGMDKNNKKQQSTKRIYHSPRIANCAGSTLSKYNTGITHTAHCTGSSANTTQDLHAQYTVLAVVQTQHRTYTQYTVLAVVQTQHRTYTHSTLCWQQCKHTCIQYRTNLHVILHWQQWRYDTGLTDTAHWAANTIQYSKLYIHSAQLTHITSYIGSMQSLYTTVQKAHDT